MNWKNKLNKRSRLLTLAAVLMICLVGSAGLIYAALPAVPYGLASQGNYPKALYDFYYKELVSNIVDVPFTTPSFMAGHGTMMAGTTNPTTASYEEVIQMIERMPTTFMRWDYVAAGTSYSGSSPYEPEANFAMPLVVFSKPPVFDPDELHALEKPIFYVHGAVHANEPSAMEAVFTMMQKLATDELGLLDRISVVVLPRYNHDGAWRMQRGTNMARGLNGMDQNRDHTMFLSPQTQLVNTVLNRYRPHMGVDPHEMGYTLNGAQRYYASGVRGTGDMTTLSATGPNYNATGSSMNLNSALYQYSLYNPIDLGNKFYNQPAAIHQRNDAMLNYVQEKLWENHKIYSFPYSFTSGNSSLSWRDTTVSVLSDDGNAYDYPGQIQERVVAFDCTPDEGYGDGALGLKGMIELCAEVPAVRIHADGFKARMYTHYAAMKYMMMYLAENAEIFLTELPEARETMANDRADLVLWSIQQPRSRTQKAIKLNAARDEVESIHSYEIPFYFDNYNTVPGPSVTRPYAYIIDGEITNDGNKINADLAAFRLAYSGIPVMRLTEPVTVSVEINRVDAIISLSGQTSGRPTSMPDRYESGAFKEVPAMASWTPASAGSNWLGAYDTEGSFGIQTHRISEATKRTETRTFPAGTYVVPTNHMSGLHASLMLEVLGKRNMGNSYYRATSITAGPSAAHLHREFFFPIEIGGDFPAYRYMENIDAMPLERVYTEQAFLKNANFVEGYPVSAGTLTAAGYTLPKDVDKTNFGFHFKAESTGLTAAHQPATTLELHLPKAYDGVELDSWYLYDWENEAFVAMPEEIVNVSSTSKANYANLSTPYISDAGEVIAIVADGTGGGKKPGGGGSSSGCNAGAGAMLLVLSLAFVTINRKR